jgi:ADP-ribose pyrophosphatase YjhB (NUDIX family)
MIDNIRIGCATFVEKDGKLLLGRRGKEPNYGVLIIPGGGVELFEPFERAAAREILEETGIEIKKLAFLFPYEIITPPGQHRIILYWRADFASGELKASSDLLDAKFYARDEIAALDAGKEISPPTREVLERAGWL